MSFASRHNKGNNWEVNTEGFEYFKLGDLFQTYGADEVYTVRGAYVNERTTKKGKKFMSVTIILDDRFASFPEHMAAEVSEMIKCEEDVADIKAGKVGFKIHTYESDYSDGICYGVTWVDVLPQ